MYDSSAEEARRLSIWKKNKALVEDHNRHASEHGFTLGMNKFADRDDGEMKRRRGLLPEKPTPEEIRKHMAHPRDFRGTYPSSVDWRDKGAVLAVKDQGHCGSCWAFGTTGVIEGQNYLKYYSSVPLSEQNLMDCSRMYGNDGCKGGTALRSYKYIIDNGGIATEASYPYTATDSISCKYNTSIKGATVISYKFLPFHDEDALTIAIATVGPIGVSIDASLKTFHLYNGTGVYYDSQCSSSNLDHMVLAVGYGTENGQDYYIVKNSWGVMWGADGYIKMARNKNNNCGIASMPSYPIM